MSTGSEPMGLSMTKFVRATEIPSPIKNHIVVVVPIPSEAKEGEIIYVLSKRLHDFKKRIAIKVPPRKYYTSANAGTEKSNHYLKVIFPSCLTKQLTSPAPTKTENHDVHSSPSKFIPRRGERVRRTPQEGEEKRYEREFRSKISIGPQYQVDPAQIPNPTQFKDVASNSADLYEQIWDPDIQNLEIYYVLDKTIPSHLKYIMMEAFHKCNYNLSAAFDAVKYDELRASHDVPGARLSKKVENLFFKTIWETRKNITEAIKTVGHKFNVSPSALLVQYYNCYKPSKEYSKLKDIKKGESDYCLVCDDGGVLICCDECSGTYHLDCLDPPLESIPKDKWYCPKCVEASANKKLRAEGRKVGPKTNISPPNKTTKKRKESNVDPTWTYWGLNQV